MRPYAPVDYQGLHRNGVLNESFSRRHRRHLTHHARAATALYVVLLPVFGVLIIGCSVTGFIVLFRFIRFLLEGVMTETINGTGLAVRETAQRPASMQSK